MIYIREARQEDYSQIYTLNQVLGYEYSLEKTKKQLVKLLNRSTDKIFVACVEDRVVGYIQISDYECLYNDPLKNIMGLAVDRDFQNRGIGRALLSKAEEWARDQGSTGLRLNSGMERKEAHGFYEHCGYKNRKEQKNYIKSFL